MIRIIWRVVDTIVQQEFVNLMVSTEASWWNILTMKIYTTLGYIVSLIFLNLGHVFRFRGRMCVADDAKAKHVSQIQED